MARHVRRILRRRDGAEEACVGDDRTQERIQARLETVERRLAALKELGLNVAPLYAQLAFARDLMTEDRLVDADNLCNEILDLAARLAKGREAPENAAAAALKVGARYYEREQLAEAVRAVLADGMLERCLADRKPSTAVSTSAPALDETKLAEDLAAAVTGRVAKHIEASSHQDLTARLEAAFSKHLGSLGRSVKRDVNGLAERLDQTLAKAVPAVPADTAHLAEEMATAVAGRLAAAAPRDLTARIDAAVGRQLAGLTEMVRQEVGALSGILDQQVSRAFNETRVVKRLSAAAPTLDSATITSALSGMEKDLIDHMRRSMGLRSRELEKRIEAHLAEFCLKAQSLDRIVGALEHLAQDGPQAAAVTEIKDLLHQVITAVNQAPTSAPPVPPVPVAQVPVVPELAAVIAEPPATAPEPPTSMTMLVASADPAGESDPTGVMSAVARGTSADEFGSFAPVEIDMPQPSERAKPPAPVVEEPDPFTPDAAPDALNRVAVEVKPPSGVDVPVAHTVECGHSHPAGAPPITDDRLREVVRCHLPGLLREPEVKQALFAVLATEVAVDSSALGELTGLRRFLRKELERAAGEMSRK